MANVTLGKAAAPLAEEEKKNGTTANAGATALPTTPNYTIDYNDARFQQVDADKKAALNQSNAQYDQMIGGVDQHYQGLIDATNQYGEKQAQLQQEQTDFAVEKIEQQKAQANKDYIKEQQGAYVDWQKQSDQYGANAEQMAASGLRGTGYSESSQVQMYTAYQNRVAVARETYNKAVLNYDNAIKDAILSNNSMQAEIAFNTLQTSLTLGIEQFQYKNELMNQKLNAQRDIDNTYYNRWQDVLTQMNEENALAEQIRQYNQTFAEDQRQFNESMNLEREQMAIARQQWQTEYDFGVRQFDESIRQFEVEMDRLKAQDAEGNKLAIKQLEMQKKQLEQEQKNWEAEMKEQKRQFDKSLAEDKRQFDITSKKASGSSGGASGGSVAINKDTDGLKVGEQKKSGPGPETSYEAFQTNIANMMVKGYDEKKITNMENQLKNAVKNKKITEKQYLELLDLLP